MIFNRSWTGEQRLYVRLAFDRNVFGYPGLQFPRKLNRVEENVFRHGGRESFRYPVERTGMVEPNVSLGVAPTYLDDRHDLTVTRCNGSANTRACPGDAKSEPTASGRGNFTSWRSPSCRVDALIA